MGDLDTLDRRDGRTVHVNMIAIRSHFAPDVLEGVTLGDTVLFHVTNIEQDWDILHGFAVLGAENAELILSPGDTKTLKWVPKTTGVPSAGRAARKRPDAEPGDAAPEPSPGG